MMKRERTKGLENPLAGGDCIPIVHRFHERYDESEGFGTKSRSLDKAVIWAGEGNCVILV